MFGAIVLRNIPKVEARIDTTRHDIQADFQGFKMVPPVSWHYVGVKVNEHHVGFWRQVGINEVIVKDYNPETGQFEDAPPDIQAAHADPKYGGMMKPGLAAYSHIHFGPWYGMVMHIPAENFPPPLHAEDAGSGSRFAKALHGAHGGDDDAFLAEFQYAFASWYVSLPSAAVDETAFDRWRHLVLAAYNAGEDAIAEAGDLFPKIIDTLLHQFDVMGDEWFESGNFLVSRQAGYMTEDMIDTGIPELAEKAEAFNTYIKKRKL